MSKTVSQPTAMPTRKVAAATAGSMSGAVVGGLLSMHVGAPFDDSLIMGGWPVLGAFLFGYLFKERAP